MWKIEPRLSAVGRLLLLLLCFSGCSSYSEDSRVDTTQVVQLLTASENKIEFEILNSQTNAVSLYVGEKKYSTFGIEIPSTASRRDDYQLLVSLEATDKLKLEGSETGHGLIFTTTSKNDKTGGTTLGTNNLALTETGPISYGRVKLRSPANIVQTTDSIELADLETIDGRLIPISIRLYVPPVPTAAVTAAVR